MIIYDYADKTSSPNLDGIHTDVAASAMTDKAISFCRWDEECVDGSCSPPCTGHLHVVFTTELSGGDKTILDGIVSDNS